MGRCCSTKELRSNPGSLPFECLVFIRTITLVPKVYVHCAILRKISAVRSLADICILHDTQRICIVVVPKEL